MLSVIMCSYKNLDEAKFTLDSLKDQECQDFETVVIDGGSGDDFVDYVKPRADIMISEQDNGLYNAFNKGIDAATREFLIYLNAGDSLADPQTIRDIYDTIEKNKGKDIFVFRSNMLGRLGKVLYVRPRKHNGKDFCHQAMVLRRSLQQDFPFNEAFNIGGDSDVWRRIRKSGRFNAVFNDRIVSNFSLGGRSTNMLNNTERSIETLWSSYQVNEKIPDREFIKIYIKNKICKIIAPFPAMIELYYRVRSRFVGGRRF